MLGWAFQPTRAERARLDWPTPKAQPDFASGWAWAGQAHITGQASCRAGLAHRGSGPLDIPKPKYNQVFTNRRFSEEYMVKLIKNYIS